MSSQIAQERRNSGALVWASWRLFLEVARNLCRPYGALIISTLNPPLRLRWRSPRSGLTSRRA